MTPPASPAAPLIVALDHSDPEAAAACVSALAGRVSRFKVGSVLFTRAGPAFVRELTGERDKRVFLDLKFHDTPATVAGAVAAAAELEIDLLTVHAAGGRRMMAAARQAADRAGKPPLLLAVTVLTSLDPAAYAEATGSGTRSLGESVQALGRMAIEEGMDGLVCSAAEVSSLRESLGSAPLLVVPGIRPAWSESDHGGQARMATPAEALQAGASLLVVGRAVTAAADPAAAAARIVAEIEAGIDA